MDILVIEGAAPRRVAVAQYLLRAAHRVTISSSIEEAREILQFITKKSEAPDAVVIGDRLASARLHELPRRDRRSLPRSPLWVPLPSDLSLQWLADWLQGAASRKTARGRRSVARGSSVLVVETNRAAREAAHARFASEGGDSPHLRVVQGRARDDGEMGRPQDAAGLHRVAHPGTRRRWHLFLPGCQEALSRCAMDDLGCRRTGPGGVDAACLIAAGPGLVLRDVLCAHGGHGVPDLLQEALDIDGPHRHEHAATGELAGIQGKRSASRMMAVSG